MLLIDTLNSASQVLPYPLARWLAAWVVNFKRPSPKPFGMVVQVGNYDFLLSIYREIMHFNFVSELCIEFPVSGLQIYILHLLALSIGFKYNCKYKICRFTVQWRIYIICLCV